MTRRDAIAIACKVMGLVVLVYMVTTLIQMMPPYSGSFMFPPILQTAFYVTIVVVPAVLLIVFSEGIARKVCGRTGDMPVAVNVSRKELLQVSMIVLGVYFAAKAVPEIFSAAASLIRAWASVEEPSIYDWPLGLFSKHFARLILGVVLIILARPRAALNLMHKLRTAGTPADDSPEDDHTQEK